MNKPYLTSKSYFIPIITLLGIGSFLAKTVFAQSLADLNIICDNGIVGPDNCRVFTSTEPTVQNKNAPLFEGLVFPHYDLKPGDNFTRKMRITNNRNETCYFELVSGEITEDTTVSTGVKFSEELKVTITDGETTVGPISFATLFAPGTLPLYLTTLPEQGLKDIDWTVTFDKNAGNEFQLAKMKFNFDWNFQCGEEPAPTVLFI
ncbi:hypothetical protein GYA27_02930 [candidate division WWE3 bacterium]|uniref:Uncharacterized protein n=1 Tax=candidate division WWE3 bacterium TaxID=2053526 RepID=A0A7X9HH86_UNCKA|nr:hypothetical protein [candidate division WWE3 bacterium]